MNEIQEEDVKKKALRTSGPDSQRSHSFELIGSNSLGITGKLEEIKRNEEEQHRTERRQKSTSKGAG